MNWWWLSFAGEEGFRGVAIVGPCAEIVTAVKIAHALDINPGGQVVGFPIPEAMIGRFPESHRERLLTKAQAEEIDELVRVEVPE